ncbi:MAG: DUF4382 domain-containing protein [Cyanobacteria bacterium J06648_10]
MERKLQQHLKTLAITTLILPLLSCGSQSASSPPGTLIIEANGEDFVRQGLTDKDGWQIDFDHVYVTLQNIVAAQGEPKFESGEVEIVPTQEVVVGESPLTVDLAAGGPDEPPIVVTEVSEAPSGQYNALKWEVVSPTTGPAEGYSLVLIGTAVKEGRTIPFNIQLAEEVAFTCGNFIGDERKGILEADETASVEATFHFDHLFGDAEAPDDDEINIGALGFDVFAELADSDELTVTSTDLEQQLTASDYNKFQAIIANLGHVGEGHCDATQIK